jgi:hypothetical protein
VAGTVRRSTRLVSGNAGGRAARRIRTNTTNGITSAALRTADCGKAYNACLDEGGEEAASARKLEFSDLELARNWIREHKSEVALGTIVVVGGTAFMLTVGAAGALILAPLAL